MEFTRQHEFHHSSSNNNQQRTFSTESMGSASSTATASIFSETSASTDSANERLRKAIERNRQRMAQKKTKESPVHGGEIPKQRPVMQETSFFQDEEPPIVPHMLPTRKGVGRIDETEFEIPFAKTKTKNKSSFTTIDYDNIQDDFSTHRSSTRSRGQSTSGYRNKTISKDSAANKWKNLLTRRLSDYCAYGAWCFCGYLFLRLIFADNGIVDFYHKKNIIKDHQAEYYNFKQENDKLIREIEKIQTDGIYQKRIVRDNLGFIAKDEFLVLTSI